MMNFADDISMRILAVLATNPGKEFYQREIAKLAEISVGATSQKLRKLSSNGLVIHRQSGRMIFYRYNLRDPVAKQLKRLLNVEALHGLVRELRDYAERIILFGSYAEGTDDVNNEVDLFVLTEHGEKVREIVRASANNVGRKISPVVLNADEFSQLRSGDRSLYKKISKGLVLWEVEENFA